MNLNYKKSAFAVSLLISLIFHLVIILTFGIIFIENEDHEQFQRIYLEFDQFEKKIVSEKKTKSVSGNLKSKIFPKALEPKKNDSFNNNELELPTEIRDTVFELKIDSLKKFLTILDSMVVNYPNLIILKSAMLEHIKQNPIVETDSAFAVRRMKNEVLTYYKNKYPTPLSKFGDQPQGFAIDKIIKMFSGEDEEEIKKIKRYLNLDTF